MASMDTSTLVGAVSPTINAAGTAFMFDAGTMAAGDPLGLDGLSMYVLGRGGVLGDVDADVVAASFAVFNPAVVRMMWEGARAKCGATEASAAYHEACAAFGRARLADVDGLDRYAEAAEAVVRSASIVGMPLFAGWRAQPLADDLPGRAMQLTNVLREHRGSAHVVGIAAAGLTGAQAHFLAKGDAQMQMMGWQEPWPDVTGLEDRLTEAEATTDRIVVDAFAVLDAETAARVAAVVDDIGAAIRA
jgi:hypothetical protein